MVTKNSIDSNIPIEVSKGGTNAATMATSSGVVKYDGTRLVTSTTFQINATNLQTNSAQPCFMALASAVANVTGDGTAYTMIYDQEIFDQAANYAPASGIFTAPITGRYMLLESINIEGLSNTTTLGIHQIVTSNRTYLSNYGNYWTTCYNSSVGTKESATMADMDAADTAYVVLTVSNGGKTVDVGADTAYNRFSGFLVC